MTDTYEFSREWVEGLRSQPLEPLVWVYQEGQAQLQLASQPLEIGEQLVYLYPDQRELTAVFVAEILYPKHALEPVYKAVLGVTTGVPLELQEAYAFLKEGDIVRRVRD